MISRRAGSIVLPNLRERIESGRFLGTWQAGTRLPSIRQIAEDEAVDRKTAAAAYRRLAEEGVVDIQPRSGVYLAPPPGTDVPAGPLERLQRRWLEQTFDGARALGLSTADILKFVEAVAEVEATGLPVVECDSPLCDALAEELGRRLQVPSRATLLENGGAGSQDWAVGPVVVTTPYHTEEVVEVAPETIVVEITMDPGMLTSILEAARKGTVLVVIPGTALLRKLQRSADLGLLGQGGTIRFASAGNGEDLERDAAAAETIVIWPGCPGDLDDRLADHPSCGRADHCISRDTLTRVRGAIVEAARRRLEAGEER